MKFELKKYYTNLSEQELLDDLVVVSQKLNKNTFTIYEYQNNGKFHYATITQRFNSWSNALKLAGLNYNRYKITNDELLNDLKKIAMNIQSESLSMDGYRLNGGKYAPETIQDRFSGWGNALVEAGLQINRVNNITEFELMENILLVWQKLGKQPTHRQIKKPLSKYSIRPYINKFKTWQNALLKFIEHVEGKEDFGNIEKITCELKNEENINHHIKTFDKSDKNTKTIKRTAPRDPNWRLRFLVMKRDNFTCTMCGRSPAKNPEIELHIDHIKPWSKGGETVLENLQTLCSVCNIGKSDFK